ncbi:hypothetical protein HMPREF9944_01872 [Segatella maculosa OT 289]|uniref:Uncharacterized protein n=1 Tax=Segatella maculosa OT 289 TaxID=999422 RepID=H1HNX8_9BACT|nr:hypothetical protein HMPREF9944_01872 [Segatella maculosa OT 289]
MRSNRSPHQPFTHQFGHEALPVHIENSRQLELFLEELFPNFG